MAGLARLQRAELESVDPTAAKTVECRRRGPALPSRVRVERGRFRLLPVTRTRVIERQLRQEPVVQPVGARGPHQAGMRTRPRDTHEASDKSEAVVGRGWPVGDAVEEQVCLISPKRQVANLVDETQQLADCAQCPWKTVYRRITAQTVQSPSFRSTDCR